MKNITFLIVMAFSANNIWAGNGHHDFSRETWSNGKSCLICHDLKNNLPKIAPSGSRVVDVTTLNDQEKAAYATNPQNLMCLTCHQEKHSIIMSNISTTNGAALPAPSTPPVLTSGTEGGITIRVTNVGMNAADCLHCHDIHTKDSPQLLRSDYNQN